MLTGSSELGFHRFIGLISVSADVFVVDWFRCFGKQGGIQRIIICCVSFMTLSGKKKKIPFVTLFTCQLVVQMYYDAHLLSELK